MPRRLRRRTTDGGPGPRGKAAYAEEDIRNRVYWTRFELTGGEWIAVPANVVIKDSNRNGAPVAWWYFEAGKLQIRCYAPGGGV
jgi:hypothetical protein